MAVFNLTATLKSVESHLRSSGYASSVVVGEPKSAMEAGPRVTAAVWTVSATIVALTAGNETIELHVLNVRLYADAFTESPETLELAIVNAQSQVAAKLLADANLNSSVRSIDAGGQYGVQFEGQYGYAEVSGKMYRIVDLTLPFIVDASATVTP